MRGRTHAYSSESLLHEQRAAAENALYAAMHALNERAKLSRRLAADFAMQFPELQAKHLSSAEEMDRHVKTLRDLLAGK